MKSKHVFDSLIASATEQGGGFFLLMDPDKSPRNELLSLAEEAAELGVDALLVGTSFVLNANLPDAVRDIKQATTLPVVIFPGSFAQISPHADAILFTSLISGRNPNYLIEEQMKGAPLVKRFGLEAIPTGYMLIESGSYTSVQYISNTEPIPRTKPEIACAHALAAQYLGMKAVYLEAGSGAALSVPPEMVGAVRSYVDLPIIVGGGLTSPAAVAERIEAGATFVVVGNGAERKGAGAFLREMIFAAHPKVAYPI